MKILKEHSNEMTSDSASYYLGLMYENGFYVQKDISKAIQYYKAPAKYKMFDAKEELDKLSN